jgi:DNA recombination protein RmuC
MLEHCDFDLQPTAVTDAGRLRPDLIVNLPGQRTIVVDAKVPLEAFLDAQMAADEGVRSGKLADHVRQVKDHVTKLGAKGYWDQFPSSPDFVVLFLPAEAIFMAALEQDAHLIDSSVRQRVLIASPLTLIALLRTAAVGWRQERLAINAEAISQLGRELYDRARTFTERLEAVGSRLDSTVRAYNEAVGTYDGRVMVSMRKFRELGAATGDAIEPLAPVETTPRPLESAIQRDLLESSEPVEP